MLEKSIEGSQRFARGEEHGRDTKEVGNMLCEMTTATTEKNQFYFEAFHIQRVHKVCCRSTVCN